MKFKAVIFDLDGTLLDTIDDLTDSMNAALVSAGLPTRTTEECKHFVGDGVAIFTRRAMGRAGCDEQALANVLAVYHDEYARRWNRKTRPYEGIGELLDALSGNGLAMAVLSNKPDDLTILTVERLLAKWQFGAVMGARSDVPHKPDPAGAFETASALGVEPADCLYVGDTNTDMRTANAAGMYAVGVLWGFRTADELTASGAKVLIERPLELMELLRQG